MKLTVVGCAGSYPSPTSAASCYLLAGDDAVIVLDMGNGSLGALLAHSHPTALDAVFISHMHADHCVDLTALYVLLKHGPHRRSTPLPVFGPAGLHQRIAAAYNGDARTDLSDVFEFKVLAAQRAVALGANTHVTPVVVDHPGESYGFRVEMGNKVLAYSGDSAECEAPVALARDADIALFEASFVEPADNQPPLPTGLHMSAGMAAHIAQRAHAKSLLLTHTVQWNEFEGGHDRELAEAVARFAGPVALAVPGMVVTA